VSDDAPNQAIGYGATGIHVLPLVSCCLATQSRIPALQAEARAKLGDGKGSAQAYESALAAKPAGDIELLQGLVSALVADGKPQQVCRFLARTLLTAVRLTWPACHAS
jgi:hypothetical protein